MIKLFTPKEIYELKEKSTVGTKIKKSDILPEYDVVKIV